MSFGMVAASYLGVVGSDAPQPILSFGFNEGTGNDFHPTQGTANGYSPGMQWTTSLAGHGSAASRTAQDEYLQTLATTNLLTSHTGAWIALTAMCWYRPMAASGGLPRMPFTFYDETETYWFFVRQNSSGALDSWLKGEATSLSAPVADDTWVHVAAVWNGATLQLYVNGTLAASTSVTTSSIVAGALDKVVMNGMGDSHRGGAIDDFRLFDAVLTPEQITYLMGVAV